MGRLELTQSSRYKLWNLDDGLRPPPPDCILSGKRLSTHNCYNTGAKESQKHA